jgi:K+-sensing histidine kinase KdpD
MTRSRTAEVGAAAAGSIAAIVVAGMLVPARDTFGNTNMALVLVVVIVGAAALGGRFVGAVTSVAAALAFNYFHTQPYRTLKVDNREDVITVVLLLIVGLIVGELANLHSSRRDDAQTRAAGAHWLEQVAGLVAGGRPVEEVWPIVQEGLVEELGLAACHFEPAPYHGQLPAVQRSGRLEGPLTWAREGFELPAGGVQLSVEHRSHLFGRVILEPTAGRGVSLEERRVAVALADQLAVALAMTGKPMQPLV